MIPTSTYRLQITPSFRLQDAVAVLDHLVELGVGAVYLSPVLTSTSGSDHGYDVTDPTAVDPQRGGEQGWRELVDAAHARGLGVVLDIVPNHLGISKPWENPAWWSVLREGEASAWAAWFDVDWPAGPILVPVLAADGDLSELTLSEDAAELHFYDHRFPVAPGTAQPGDDPREVLQRQHYRLIPGVEGNERLTYRRFFAVETLAGVRIEDPEVYRATHRRVLQMVADGDLDGLRVDHPDGLVDPAGYFDRLHADCPELWLVAEKVLEHGEPMPRWQVSGTTGYDAMTWVNQVFVDPAAEAFFTADYQRRTGDQLDVEGHVLAGKQLVARTLFRAETSRLQRLLDHAGLDADLLRTALEELAARLDVYRTYLPQDSAALERALRRTRAEVPRLGAALDVLEPQLLDPRQEAALRFQQLSGAVMAKGVEDTAWYRANRFVALNEVGGNPASFGTSVQAFHDAMQQRERDLPQSMTALSTHDTKRGEDVRARLAALAELGEQWAHFADVFTARTRISEPTFAVLLAQTLAGVGPVEPQRLHAYAEKAMREAALATSWTEPDGPFESQVHEAIDLAFRDEALREAWQQLQGAIAGPGHSNAAAQKLVQLTMPGIPDVYQGTEVWEDSLVDPDNRRPVPFAELRELVGTTPASPGDPAYKLHLVRTALQLRRDRPELFHGYRPVSAEGAAAEHLLAFERHGVLTLATRLPVRLQARGGWGQATIGLEGSWTNLLALPTPTSHQGRVLLADVLGSQPVALLVRE